MECEQIGPAREETSIQCVYKSIAGRTRRQHCNVDKHMTAAIINIAHNLGLKVVAEGVEQERQLEILRRYECEMLQGYLYSKPLNANKFERLLAENLHINQLINAT